MCLVAWPAQHRGRSPSRGTSTSTPSTSCRRSTTCSASSRPTVIKGYQQSPIEGESFAASAHRPERRRPRRRSSTRCSASARSTTTGWLACTLHPPLSGWGKFDQDVWELYDLEHGPRAVENLATRSRSGSSGSRALWFEYAGSYNGLPLDDRSAIEQVLADRPHARRRRATATSTTPTAPTFPSSPACASTAARTRSPPGSRSTIPAPRACSTRTAASRAGTACTSRTSACATRSTGSARTCRTIVADRDVTPGPRLHREFAVKGKNDDPAMPGFAGTLTLYIDDQPVGSGEIVTQPGVFCLVGDGICVGRDSASPVTPDYIAPFRFTGGTIDKVDRRRLRRALHRPRGPGPRLVHEGLIRRRPGERTRRAVHIPLPARMRFLSARSEALLGGDLARFDRGDERLVVAVVLVGVGV